MKLLDINPKLFHPYLSQQMHDGKNLAENYSITEQMSLAGTSGEQLAQSREKPKAGCTGPCPFIFSISPRMKTLLLLSATCASAQSPSE